MPDLTPSFQELVAHYQNTAAHNDYLHRSLTDATWSDVVLAEHRRYVETNKLGFGDACFHALWARLLHAAAQRFGTVRALEIGVFKGQVVCLWAVIAMAQQLDVRIHALAPLAGQPLPRFRWWVRLRYCLDRRFREWVDNGNFYDHDDYEGTIRLFFARFGVNFDDVILHRGFSTDTMILNTLSQETFHVVYVDGDHTYRGALHDFTTFGPKVVPGGWLVADDAGRELPGTTFWKGHEATTRAAQVLPSLGFKNVLNVGHNRVYERIAS
jgi:predicted O-methyltransferase YrrM